MILKEELRREVFIKFVNAIDEMVLFFDAFGTCMFINENAENELGYPDDGKTELPDVRTVFPLFFSQTDSAKMVLKKLCGKSEKTTMYRKNQTCFPASVHFQRIENEDLFFCFVNSEIEKEEIQQEMIQAEQEMKMMRTVQNEFVANVTHELRTPLNGIRGYIEQMSQEDFSIEQKNRIYIIERCCKTMEGIINNILDFSKIQSGKFELEEHDFSLLECLQQVVETNEPTANMKGLLLSMQMADDIPEKITGDSAHLVQILNNLVSNAVKFTETGFVKIKAVKTYQLGHKMEVFFVVVDSGIGVAPEDKEKIFKSFTQADASITRRYGGTGLGLSITKQLLQMMGGVLNLESEVGKGSTFSFSLVFKVPSEYIEAEQLQKQAQSETQAALMREEEREQEQARKMYEIGSAENVEALQSNMEKLILCIEMESWIKAEMFATMIKKLLREAPTEWTKKAFRLEMAVRRESKEKALPLFEELKTMIENGQGADT